MLLHNLFLSYRDEWIRTTDHLNPIQVLYQTELHPEWKFKFSKQSNLYKGKISLVLTFHGVERTARFKPFPLLLVIAMI